MAEDRFLIDEAALRSRCRLFSNNYTWERMAPSVLEAQQAEIKPQIGDALFIRLLSPDYAASDPYATLLDGGRYTDGCCGGERIFDGLRTALSYYVYGRLITSSVNYLGTTGLRTATDSTAVKAEYEERERVRLDARRMAESYMRDALLYAKSVDELRALLPGCGCNGSGRRPQALQAVEGPPPDCDDRMRHYGRYSR